MLKDISVDFYETYYICMRTKGRMAEDHKRIKFVDSDENKPDNEDLNIKLKFNYSSKGNQWKNSENNYWHKMDFLGYEAAAEILPSLSLSNSNIKNFVKYSYEDIIYCERKFNGCMSENFLKENEDLITVERLYKSFNGISLGEALKDRSAEDKIKYFVSALEKITNLNKVGEYITSLLEFDMVTLNEDRHLITLHL